MTAREPGRDPGRRRALVGSIAFVALLAVLALVFFRPLVAWLTGTSAGGAEGAPVAFSRGSISVEARLAPDPPRQKGNTLVLDVMGGGGGPIDDASVAVQYDMPAMRAMPEMKGSAEVTHEGRGRYRAAFDLPMAGSWTLRTTIKTSAGEAKQALGLTVGTPGLTKAGGTGGGGDAGSDGAAHAYAPVVVDALRSALDAYERLRASLAADDLRASAEPSRTLAEALRAAAAAMEKDEPRAAEEANRAAGDADRVGRATSIDEARTAFASLSAAMLHLVSADRRLTEGLHAFECSMAEGTPRWIQRGEAPENPYMGKKMPACGSEQAWQAPEAAEPGGVDHYTCPMHPSVKQASPGNCPICGMALVPVARDDVRSGLVAIDAARRQLIGVRTAPVVLGPMTSRLRAVGRVDYDESALADVSLKVRGWITKLYVSRTGERIGKGQRLFDLYSPELYNAQQDFLLATRGASSASATDGGSRVSGLASASRQRLRLLGMSDAQIDALARNGAPSESVTFTAPAGGFVIEKDAVEGAAIEAGMRVYRIAALNKVWVDADVYEADLAHVRVGQRAEVTLDYLPGQAYEAKVAYVYPYLDTKARTGRVRIELANKGLELRPGMYANVSLFADLGPRVQVPAPAVIYTGPRRLVFVDLGDGRFAAREVQVGLESQGIYEVKAGLRPGEIVATSGVFLIAAEARIRTAATYWEPERPDAASVP